MEHTHRNTPYEHETTVPLPQADGDSRPVIHDLGDLPGPRLVHVEKSGSAFVPLSVADQLGASLVVQTLTAVGEVYNAMDRACFLDLLPAWTRLLRMAQVTVPLGESF